MNNKLQTILYVEDEPDIQAIAKISLEDLGHFTVKFCSSGQEALDAVATFNPDLILLDVMMPGMDGPTTLKNLRADPNLINVPVIFMTAKVQANEIDQYLKMGAIDVIPKPFDPMTLPEKLNAIWSKYMAVSQH